MCVVAGSNFHLVAKQLAQGPQPQRNLEVRELSCGVGKFSVRVSRERCQITTGN